MNRELKKQIKAYAGVAGAILSAEKLNAQVVYTDINPDTTIALTASCCSLGIDIDIDNDSVNDIFLEDSASYLSNIVSAINVWSAGGTPHHILVDSSLGNPLALSNGAYIGNAGFWGYGYLLLAYINGTNFSSGNWFVGDDKCLGVRLQIAGQIHYGWIHLEILGPKSFKLKDYAYQLQPNVPMLACDTTNLATGIIETTPQFTFSQHNHSIHISAFQKLNHAAISVYDLLGKEILKQPFERKETTITIDKKGIYFVEVTGEKGIFRKKIFIY